MKKYLIIFIVFILTIILCVMLLIVNTEKIILISSTAFKFDNTEFFFDPIKENWIFNVNGTNVVILTKTNMLVHSLNSTYPSYAFVDSPKSGIWYDKNYNEIKIALNGSSNLIIGNDYVKFLNSDFIMPTVKPSKPKAGSTFLNLTSKTTNCYDGSNWYYCGNGTLI